MPWRDYDLVSEPGIRVLSRLAYYVRDDYTTMFALAAAITIGLSIYTLYRDSNAFAFSVLLYVITGPWLGSFNGVRQYLACAIIFAGHRLVLERRFGRWLLVVLVAGLFHISAYLMVLLYFVPRRRLSPVSALVLIVMAGFATEIYGRVLDLVVVFREDQDFGGQASYFVEEVNPLRIAAALAPLAFYVLFTDKTKLCGQRPLLRARPAAARRDHARVQRQRLHRPLRGLHRGVLVPGDPATGDGEGSADPDVHGVAGHHVLRALLVRRDRRNPRARQLPLRSSTGPPGCDACRSPGLPGARAPRDRRDEPRRRGDRDDESVPRRRPEPRPVRLPRLRGRAGGVRRRDRRSRRARLPASAAARDGLPRRGPADAGADGVEGSLRRGARAHPARVGAAASGRSSSRHRRADRPCAQHGRPSPRLAAQRGLPAGGPRDHPLAGDGSGGVWRGGRALPVPLGLAGPGHGPAQRRRPGPLRARPRGPGPRTRRARRSPTASEWSARWLDSSRSRTIAS